MDDPPQSKVANEPQHAEPHEKNKRHENPPLNQLPQAGNEQTAKCRDDISSGTRSCAHAQNYPPPHTAAQAQVGVAFAGGVCLTPPQSMIGLHAHAEKPAAAEVVRAMVRELESAGLPYLLERSTAPLAGKSSDLDLADLASRCELLVVMGGDGTILRAVQKLQDTIPTVFGINIGTLGFLTCLGSGEVQRAVECIRNRDFVVCPRNQIGRAHV